MFCIIYQHEEEVAMIILEADEEEAKLLLNILERYHSHLEVEIAHTNSRVFREALKEREKSLKSLIEKMKKLVS